MGRPLTRALLRERGPAVAVVALVVLATIHAVCDVYFACGCVPIWAGGTDPCNIHVHGVPHCPWCMGGPARATWVTALISTTTLAGILLPRGPTARDRTLRAITLGLAGYALGATIASLLAAYAEGYPTWLGLEL